MGEMTPSAEATALLLLLRSRRRGASSSMTVAVPPKGGRPAPPPEGVVLVSGLTNPAGAAREREPVGECSVRGVGDVVEGTTR